MHRAYYVLVFLFMILTTSLRAQHDAKRLQELTDSLIGLVKYELIIDTVERAKYQLESDNDSLAVSVVLNNLAHAYFQKGHLDHALHTYRMSLRHLQNGSIESASRLNGIGICYRKQGNLSRSLDYTLKAYSIFSDAGVLNQVASTASTLGLLFWELANQEESIRYFKKAQSIWASTNPDKLHILYNNMGNAWFSTENFDSATYYYRLALANALNHGQAVGKKYNNLAEVFMEQGYLDSASVYFHLSLRLKRASGNRSGMAYTYNMLGNLALVREQLNTAERYLDSAQVLERGVGSLSIRMKNLQLFRQLYQKQGRYKQALLADEAYDILKDSVFNQEKIKTLELQAAYDLEKKENERHLAEQAATLARTNQEIEKQRANNILIGLVAVGILLLLASILLVLLLRQRKELKKLNNELDKQNAHIAKLNRQNLHFTKNSLTELLATIRLQASRLSNPEARQTLVEGSVRMQTVNALYKRLFLINENDAQTVEADVFLQEIIDGTLEAMLPLENEVKVDSDIAGFSLNKEQGLSLGLLVNEVLVNACKYAFNSSKGLLVVKTTYENNVVSMLIEDSGPGISGEIEPDSNAFGFSLINSLAADLDAKWERKSTSSGVSYYFSFPLSE